MQRGIAPDYGFDDLRRWLRRLPIRWRLTVTFAAVMAVLLAALIAFLFLRFRSDLDYNIDQSLRARAQDIAGLVRQQDSASTRGALRRLAPSADNVVQVLSLDGRVLASTEGAGEPVLLRETELAAAARRPRLITRGKALRLYSLPLPADRKIVVAGVSLAERDAALDKLETALATGTPPALLLATIAAYALAAAALRPVERMRGRAALISTDELGTRLPLPDTRDEIRRLGVTLNEMLDRLEDGLHRERLFIASASHELRMPLTVLRAELEVALRERAGVTGLRAAIGSAIEETDRISRLAEDLLTLARAEDGTLPVALEPVAVAQLLDDLRARFAPLVGEQQRTLSVDVSALEPGGVALADPARVLQAISNLIDNTLRYGAGPVTLRAQSTPTAVTVHVCDRGPGFDEALLPRALDRFSRADPARRRGGVGLGLAVVQTIARAHGGRAGARNLDGGGADVWIELPVAGARPPDSITSATA
jgi:signal transduction histidine kinase